MRIKLLKGEQRRFLNNVAKKTGFSWNTISRLSSVSRRTFFDWRREKYLMVYEALLKLQKISEIPSPKDMKILPEYCKFHGVNFREISGTGYLIIKYVLCHHNFTTASSL